MFIFSGYLTVFDIVDLSGKPRKLECAGEIQTTRIDEIANLKYDYSHGSDTKAVVPEQRCGDTVQQAGIAAETGHTKRDS